VSTLPSTPRDSVCWRSLACLTYGLDVIGSRPIQLRLGAGLFAAAVLAGVFATNHLRTVTNPIVRLQALRIPTFFAGSIFGGNISRAAISTTPFLLPLMFQVGFGLTPVASGMFLLIYMLANLLMKVFTNRILKRFGMRTVLIVNGAIASAAIAACSIISPALPLAMTAAILFLAGASRSMQFTAITFVSFADIAAEERASASVLASLTQQISMGMGVAVGALMLNFSQMVRGAPTLAPYDFRLALVLAGLLSALALISYASLPANAGAEITGT
jgi:MFS family permease